MMSYSQRRSQFKPPTVPAGSARLRVTLSAEHSDEQLDRLLDALDKARGMAA